MKVGKPSDIVAVPASPASVQGAGAKSGGTRPASAAGRARASETSAGVTVSVRTHSLVQAEMAVGSDIDMNKVEAVRAAIQQGTFKMNPEVIADKLLANARDMLGRDHA